LSGILLGDFFGCEDRISRFLASAPSPKNKARIMKNPEKAKLKPLRGKISQSKGLAEIFGRIGKKYQIPVMMGLPIGHGPGLSPLPLGGARYSLKSDGSFRLLNWDWLR